MSDWGQGSKNNNIGWGQGAVNNSINWGSVHADSWAGDTDIVGGGYIYDATYQAVLDYATTQGYTLPSDSQKLLQNQLVIDLKAGGIWDKLDTFVNFATDGSSSFALIDWKRLTQYTAVNSPTFTTNEGFTGNGTSSYIDTNFNPAISGVNYTLNDASRYIYTLNVVNFFDGIELSASNRITTAGTAQRINQGTGAINSAYSFSTGAGMKSIHRTSSTNVELFSDITQESRTANSFIVQSEKQFISRSLNTYSANKVSMYAMCSSLVTENTDFVNAFDNYLNSL
jgi:stage V sporulation protein SpoVS